MGFFCDKYNTKGALPSRPSMIKNRQKPLPPVRTLNATSRTINHQSSNISKPAALPPIENTKKISQNLPIIFILSKFLF